MRTLIIEFNGPNGQLDVADDHGRCCGGLTLGETLEQIILMNSCGTERYEMLTPDEREQRREQRRKLAELPTTPQEQHHE